MQLLELQSTCMMHFLEEKAVERHPDCLITVFPDQPLQVNGYGFQTMSSCTVFYLS